MNSYQRQTAPQMDGTEYNRQLVMNEMYDNIEERRNQRSSRDEDVQEFRDKGYIEKNEIYNKPSFDVEGFWDPDDDTADYTLFLDSFGKGGLYGGKQGEKQRAEIDRKWQARQDVVHRAAKSAPLRSDKDEPCFEEKFTFETCLQMYRHTIECNSLRDSFERCKSVLAHNMRYDPVQKQRNIVHQRITGIGKVAKPPKLAPGPDEWQEIHQKAYDKYREYHDGNIDLWGEYEDDDY